MFFKKKKEEKELKKRKKSIIREYVESFIIALILALIVKYSIVEAYKIPSGSMEDTLLVGDFLLANKFIYGSRIPLINYRLPAIKEPKQGDVVIFKYPQNPKVNYIKRCIATEGQVVEIKNKVIYVDGKVFPNPPVSKFTDRNSEPAQFSPRDNFGPYKVPQGYLFVMGDNRDNSYDSRFWGPLERELVLGKAMIIHWSWAPDENAPDISKDDILSIPKNIGYNIIHFFQRVRWKRIGDLIT